MRNQTRYHYKLFASIIVAFFLFLTLVLFLCIGTELAFFLVGSINATIIFLVILLCLLLHRHFFDVALKSRALAFAALTPVLISVIVLLCIRVKPTFIIFVICGVFDLVLILGICSSFLAPRLISQYKQMRSMQSGLLSDREEEEPQEVEFSYLRRVGSLPRKFRYEELKAATNNFQTPIGRGGSGSVFKGALGDGQQVAVKRIEGELHGEREFRSEITAIVSAQHKNLVRILGYCLVLGGYRYLVYEFVHNGSLDSWIFPGKGEKDSYLTWGMRYQVSIDIAKALAYLHHDCRSRILHLDVKPQNILLDENFSARVSDFGISRMMDKDESRVVTTIRGTRGYLAPEWFSREGISEKSDVYSYGMVLLELVGGRKNWEFYDNGNISQRTWFYFPKVVSEKMREGKLMEVVDERLIKDGGIDENEARVLVYVALWCIQERVELRPSMELVVSMLKGHIPVHMPPETRMFLVDLVVPIASETHSGLSKAQGSTSADCPAIPTHSISISTMSGR